MRAVGVVDAVGREKKVAHELVGKGLVAEASFGLALLERLHERHRHAVGFRERAQDLVAGLPAEAPEAAVDFGLELFNLVADSGPEVVKLVVECFANGHESVAQKENGVRPLKYLGRRSAASVNKRSMR